MIDRYERRLIMGLNIYNMDTEKSQVRQSAGWRFWILVACFSSAPAVWELYNLEDNDVILNPKPEAWKTPEGRVQWYMSWCPKPENFELSGKEESWLLKWKQKSPFLWGVYSIWSLVSRCFLSRISPLGLCLTLFSSGNALEETQQ
jgi:hypothetical protein